MGVMHKLGNDYVNFCKECCMHALVRPVGVGCGVSLKPRVIKITTRSEPLQFEAEHYRKLYTCFSAFVLLYLPEPGFQDVPVGDELMEWLNTHFIEPSTQEGDELSAQERPWEDPNFWPYLTRCDINLPSLLHCTEFIHYQQNFPSWTLQGFRILSRRTLQPPFNVPPAIGTTALATAHKTPTPT